MLMNTGTKPAESEQLDTHRSDTSPGRQRSAKLVSHASLWSLNRGRSVRLQQWGEWIAYEDQSESAKGKQFWYNHLTQETQWDMPRDVQLLQGRSNGYVYLLT
jgi:WW domain